MRDITLGQYYPANSILHRLDPRVKIVGTLIYLVSLFLVQRWGLFAGLGALVLLVIFSEVPVSFMLRGLKAVWILLLITSLFNIFLTDGTILWQWSVLKITREGLQNALVVIFRLVMLIMGASLMTLTTTPTRLTDGLERLLRPLNRIHVPVHEVAMMMSIALRFIPILVEETDRIMKAQMARGVDFDDSGLLHKIRALMPLLVPLFVSAFRRANDLAMAMDARCYRGGEGRTQMNPLQYSRRDVISYVILLVFLAGFIIMCVFGL